MSYMFHELLVCDREDRVEVFLNFERVVFGQESRLVRFALERFYLGEEVVREGLQVADELRGALGAPLRDISFQLIHRLLRRN